MTAARWFVVLVAATGGASACSSFASDGIPAAAAPDGGLPGEQERVVSAPTDGGAPDGARARDLFFEDEGPVTQVHTTNLEVYWLRDKSTVRFSDKLVVEAHTSVVALGRSPLSDAGITGLATDETKAWALVYGDADPGADQKCRALLQVDKLALTLRNGACGETTSLFTTPGSAGKVFFGNFLDGSSRVLECEKATSVFEPRYTNEPFHEACLGKGHLYVTDDARLHVIHIDRTGTTGPLEYASTSGIVTSIACDEEGVMWTTDIGELHRVPHYELGGPAPVTSTVLAKGLVDPHALVVAGDRVYVATGIESRGSHEIRSAPRATQTSGELPVVWAATRRIDSFVLEPTEIFAAVPEENRIYRIPRGR